MLHGPTILIRFTFVLLASILGGLYGYLFGLVGLLIHLATIHSFGAPPYLTGGYTSLRPQEAKDTAIRAPLVVDASAS